MIHRKRLLLLAAAATAVVALSGFSWGKKTTIEIVIEPTAASYISVSDCKPNYFIARCVVTNKTATEFELYHARFKYRTVD